MHFFLVFLIQAGDHRSVKILICLGADVNKSDKYGSTPLDYAFRPSKQPQDVPMKDMKRDDTVFLQGKDAKKAGLAETTEVTKSYAIFLGRVEKPKSTKIIYMMRHVGALTGEELRMKKVLRPPLPKPMKIDSILWKKMEGEIDAILKIDSPTAEQALRLVQLLKEKEKCRKVFGSRILCLDGGGIRGLVQMCILQEIERRTGKSVTELFDWIVGTSTGGILALALTYGWTGAYEYII